MHKNYLYVDVWWKDFSNMGIPTSPNRHYWQAKQAILNCSNDLMLWWHALLVAEDYELTTSSWSLEG